MVNKPIFLIGMMGSGKTTVGSELANSFNLSFIDIDEQIILREGKSITAIFKEHGEAYFRLLEQQQIDQLPNEDCVVACGGGLPCYGNLMSALTKKGIVIYLDGSAELLFERIAHHTKRPLLNDFKSFEALYFDRVTIYEKAHIKVDAALPPHEIIAAIKKKLSAFNKGLF